MQNIMIINGPNLNMLGKREPEIYGTKTLREIEKMCHERASELDHHVTFFQSNFEGQIIDWIHMAFTQSYDGLVINAAAYTHTSVAIHDALKILHCPVMEVHLSDPKKRESFRHLSFVEPLATEVFSGHGAQGYIMALEKLAEL
ncbi:MAG: type II 3-dehydroquinate dehydratase [Alphaproteobacteria bacterium]